jgi:hypothetical protein
MAKFSKLVKFRNSMAAVVNDLELTTAINSRIDILNGLKDDDYPEITDLIDEFKLLISANQQTVNTAKKIVDETEVKIDQLGLELFGSNTNFKSSGSIELNEELQDYINTRIANYCEWQYPAMLLYVNHNSWISSMVASDPLYLTHRGDIKTLKRMIQGYDQVYQNRLRLYDIRDDDFSLLPQEQFSYILSWNVFNYISMDGIKDYLIKLYPLLRPGGVLMFSYNNCDKENSAALCEIAAGGYASSRAISAVIESQGYELIKFEDFDFEADTVSWVELRRSGDKTTVKAHQAMAEIKRK